MCVIFREDTNCILLRLHPVPVPSIAATSVDARVTFGSTETSGTVVQSDSILSAGGSSKEPLKINACGLQCPGPIMQVKKARYS